MAQQKSTTQKNNATRSTATNNKKKNNTKKKSNSKKRTSAKKKQKTLYDIVAQESFLYILMLVAGIVLFLLTFVNGGFMTVWNKLRSTYFGIFGLGALLLPFFYLFRAVMGFIGKDNYKYRTNSIIVLVGAILVGSVIFVVDEATPMLSFGDSVVACVEDFWVGSDDFLVTATGLFSTMVGGAFFALGQNVVLAVILLILLLIADILLLFRLSPQRIYQLLKDPLAQLAYISGQNRERIKEQSVREKEKKKPELQNKEKDTAKKNRQLSLFDEPDDEERETKNSRRARSAQQKPAPQNESADERSAKSPVTAASTKALIEEFELDIASEDTKSEELYKSIPDLFTVPDSEIASIFNVHEEPVVKQEIPIIKPAEEPAVQPAEMQTSTVSNAEKEVIPALSEIEKEAAREELNAALEADEEPEFVYELPPIDILSLPKQQANVNNEAELQANGEKLIAALKSFNVAASIQAIVPGPTVTRYELSPAPGVKINRFVSLADDLALHLAAPAGLRIEAPIPNKAAIGIEVPNKSRRVIAFREILDTRDYRKSTSKLNAGLGKDISGNIICTDIAKMPHLLVAGTTGSGKSVCMNTMICSLLYNASPDEVKLLLIDPKQVEFSVYNGIPHLLVPVVSDPRKAAGALAWAVTEMLSRYKTLNANGVRDIGAYNQLCDEVEGMKKMPQIVIFIDELSDLMTVAPSEVEDSIQRLAQMARAAGMHLVIATQRPSVDVITGVIKANIPSRIALSVSSQVDSRTIIDSVGAEKLMGYGDMLYYPVGVPKPMRVQGAFLSDDDIQNVVAFIKNQGATNYNDEVQQEIERNAVQEKKKGSASVAAASGDVDDAYEELVRKAIELFVGTPEKASVSSLQRHLRLGYSKAGSLMDVLEERGIVGPSEGSKPRKVLITKAQWYEMQAGSADTPAADSADVPFTPDENADE